MFPTFLIAEEVDTKPLSLWLKAQQGVQTVSADFTQTRKLTSLKNEIKTSGKLWISYPDKFLWQMGEPAKALILRNGKQMQFVNKRKETVDSFSVSSSEGRKYAFMTSRLARDIDSFHESFKVTRTWRESGVYYILFQPKSGTLRKRVPYLALGILESNNKLALFEMHLEDKSVIRTTFARYTTNVEIDAGLFELAK